MMSDKSKIKQPEAIENQQNKNSVIITWNLLIINGVVWNPLVNRQRTESVKLKIKRETSSKRERIL